MFRFRGQRKDNDEWVVGYLTNGRSEGVCFIEDNALDFGIFMHEVHPSSLSFSTGKPDSKKEEIFASFPLDGVMTEGGDVVERDGELYNVQYSLLKAEIENI